MISQHAYDIFIEEMKKRMQKSTEIVLVLSEILFIGRESIYRRLRGEVSFTFAEIAKISNYFNISLDGILQQSATVVPCSSFYLQVVDFINPGDADYTALRNHVDFVECISQDSLSEIAWIANIITVPLIKAYEYLYNFYLFKWNYQFTSIHEIKKMADIKATDRLRSINKDYLKRIKQFEKNTYILNEKTIANLVKDISYFVNAQLITKEESSKLKDELYLLIDELDRLTLNGAFETGKKVEIYISPVKFDSNYFYFKSLNYCLTLIRSLTLSSGYSVDTQVFDRTKRITVKI
ncbi:MAG: hypothetical protein LBV72_10375 [Tannerella sp.]|jgi:hypothetical protein|nr:hypothetical protein [Tannerella sp.]